MECHVVTKSLAELVPGMTLGRTANSKYRKNWTFSQMYIPYSENREKALKRCYHITISDHFLFLKERSTFFQNTREEESLCRKEQSDCK